MATKFDLDALFKDFYVTSKEVLSTFESVFGIEGVCNQFFGMEVSSYGVDESSEIEIASMNLVKKSGAWNTLVQLYEYAVHGVDVKHLCASDVVIGGAEVVSFLRTENATLSNSWEEIIWLGDGRFALDSGDSIDIRKIALLAGVDIRTVRNAISAGDLIAFKDQFTNDLHVENTSGRNWLAGRRGFVPTAPRNSNPLSLANVKLPYQFGALIKERRTALGLNDNPSNLVPFHSSINLNSLKELELGAFKLPLDAVFPLADYLQFNRKDFLDCVMRVYFREELETLVGGADAQEKNHES